MNLEDLIDNSRTDKNTIHSYLPTYQNIISKKKDSALNVLEIGISAGGSIKLWHDYFTQATIHGLDIIKDNDIWIEIKNKERIKIYSSTNAYDDKFFNSNFLKKMKCDIIIDDGPHTLDSMKKFIKLYSQIMTNDGVLIIEDIKSLDWCKELKKEVPENLQKFIKIYDLRNNKNRYDDIIFTIDKLNL